ncbi:MAG: glutathione-disulfide reductase [Rhizobiales bacterium 65-9]|nr:glutathione-disulfide reductase [Hyphomicrobiales bacterium]OJY33265.1 MAG: glutathione-disulfide reductase [Rhizobiales bacterium 65-9]
MSEFDVDLFVIGAGSGGVRAARIAAGHGARVMIAEDDRIGGTCVIRGCVPKKLLVYGSRYADDFEDAGGFGWDLGEPRFDWGRLRDRVEAEVTRLSGLYRRGLELAKTDIVETRATIAGPHKVALASGQTVSAKYILVATGGRPSLEPVVPGGDMAITSDEVFHLPRLPERMVVVGGGYIALEFASVFARFGTKVAVVHRRDNVLRGFDEDLRTRLRDGLLHAGIELKLGLTIERGEKLPDGRRRAYLSDGQTIDADVVLVATGRSPNTKNLGLEEAGVALDEAGAIKVDSFSQSSVPSIYAVGDVTNRINLTPVAIREGHAVADSLFSGRVWSVDRDLIPTAVFTTPEVGTVGLSEHEARALGHPLKIFETSFRPMRATLSGREERVYMKLVVDSFSDRVLGAHMLGHDAAEIIQSLAVAVRMGATKRDFDATMALHPSAAEEFVTMRVPARD